MAELRIEVGKNENAAFIGAFPPLDDQRKALLVSTDIIDTSVRFPRIFEFFDTTPNVGECYSEHTTSLEGFSSFDPIDEQIIYCADKIAEILGRHFDDEVTVADKVQEMDYDTYLVNTETQISV